MFLTFSLIGQKIEALYCSYNNLPFQSYLSFDMQRVIIVVLIFHYTEDAGHKKLKSLKDRMRQVCASLPKTMSGQPAFEETNQPYQMAIL